MYNIQYHVIYNYYINFIHYPRYIYNHITIMYCSWRIGTCTCMYDNVLWLLRTIMRIYVYVHTMIIIKVISYNYLETQINYSLS